MKITTASDYRLEICFGGQRISYCTLLTMHGSSGARLHRTGISFFLFFPKVKHLGRKIDAVMLPKIFAWVAWIRFTWEITSWKRIVLQQNRFRLPRQRCARSFTNRYFF